LLAMLLERCEAGVEVAPSRNELRLALGEATLDLGSALPRRREALLQLRQLPFACDRGLRDHLLAPADPPLPPPPRLLTPGVARGLRERSLVHVRMVIGVQEQPAVRAALKRAKARLDRLQLYPAPVRIGRVRIHVWPRLFRLPWFNRFDGYAAWNTILLRDP